MEDKILIKSEVNKKAKSIFIGIVISLFAISVFLFFTLFTTQVEHYSYYFSSYMESAFEAAFNGDGGWLAIFIIACSFILFGIIGLIIFWAHSKCELTITEKNVKGKTLFGKEVVLPMYMISAYTTRKFLSTIAVATSSGITKFSLIGNYIEIGEILSKKINEGQENTSNAASAPVAQSNSMDDLLKLKNLDRKSVV